MACEWKGEENPCRFKVCGLFKDLWGICAQTSLFSPNLQASCKLSRRISLWCVLHLYFLWKMGQSDVLDLSITDRKEIWVGDGSL